MERRGHLITEIRVDLIDEYTEQYATVIKVKEATLDSCVGKIYYSEIQMSLPGGSGTLHRSCYSGRKRITVWYIRLLRHEIVLYYIFTLLKVVEYTIS